MVIQKWLDDLTVKRSWDAVLLGFSLMILCLGGISLYASQFSHKAFLTLDRLHVRQTGALHRTYINLLQAQVAMDRAAELIRVPSFDEPGPVIAEAESLMDDARRAFQTFIDIPADEEQIAAIEALSSSLHSLLNVGLNLQLTTLKQGNFSSYRSGRGRVNEMNSIFITHADEFLENAELQSQQLSARFDKIVQQTVWILALNILAALTLVLIVRWGVTANVIRPLQRILDHFRTLAAGDLSMPLEQKGRNEIGRLYHGVEQLRQGLATIVQQVRSGCENIHKGTGGIANGNSDLSVRFEQLAASLVQTSASMEEITTTVQLNEENATQGRKLAQDARQVANRGGEVVNSVINSMNRIRAGSEQIAEITSAIQSIAFQTNILALNASVEAVRAGEHGKGFAVVAEEVRNLAQHSDSLARDIKNRIETAMTDVSHGASEVEQAGTTMTQIVAAVTQVSDIMDEIANASREQTLGIEQVRIAVVEMDKVTQQNVGLVAETAVSADALNRQADDLIHSVDSFTLLEDDGDSDPMSDAHLNPLPA